MPASPDSATNPSPGAKDFLKQLGMTKRMAMKILADGRSEKYLNTKVTARVLLVSQANSVDQVNQVQRMAAKLAKNPDMDFRTRVSCMMVVPQCGMALARLSEVALATARNLDLPEDAGGGDAAPKIAQQNNFFGFPPVADPPDRKGSVFAKLGDSPVTDVTEVPKPG